MRNGNRVALGVKPVVEPIDKPMPPTSSPPLAPPDVYDEPHHAPTSTTWPAIQLPLLARMEDEASMAPYVMVDESGVNVGGKRAQEIVLLTPSVILVRIEPDRSKKTIRRIFRMALSRPLVADMYRAAGAFTGKFQTCFVHVWRKCESMAVKLYNPIPRTHLLYNVVRRVQAGQAGCQRCPHNGRGYD